MQLITVPPKGIMLSILRSFAVLLVCALNACSRPTYVPVFTEDTPEWVRKGYQGRTFGEGRSVFAAGPDWSVFVEVEDAEAVAFYLKVGDAEPVNTNELLTGIIMVPTAPGQPGHAQNCLDASDDCQYSCPWVVTGTARFNGKRRAIGWGFLKSCLDACAHAHDECLCACSLPQ